MLNCIAFHVLTSPNSCLSASVAWSEYTRTDEAKTLKTIIYIYIYIYVKPCYEKIFFKKLAGCDIMTKNFLTDE